MTSPEIAPLLARCRGLRADAPPSLRQLADALREVSIDAAAVAAVGHADPSRPYGRRVLLADAWHEAMVARWTRGAACAPHDHGGSVGGVRVLTGEAVHRVWRARDGALELAFEERVVAGEVLACGPDLVHSMEDGGAIEPLATLHLYSGPIAHMLVYDLDGARTLVVEGGCGAWLPWDQPSLIRAIYPGLHGSAALRAASALPA